MKQTYNNEYESHILFSSSSFIKRYHIFREKLFIKTEEKCPATKVERNRWRLNTTMRNPKRRRWDTMSERVIFRYFSNFSLVSSFTTARQAHSLIQCAGRVSLPLHHTVCIRHGIIITLRCGRHNTVRCAGGPLKITTTTDSVLVTHFTKPCNGGDGGRGGVRATPPPAMASERRDAFAPNFRRRRPDLCHCGRSCAARRCGGDWWRRSERTSKWGETTAGRRETREAEKKKGNWF